MKHSSQYSSYDKSEWSHSHNFPIEEIWNTETTIAAFVAPRLKAFKSLKKHGFPPGMGSERQWNSTIQKMIDAFEILGRLYTPTDEEDPIVEEGLAFSANTIAIFWTNINFNSYGHAIY